MRTRFPSTTVVPGFPAKSPQRKRISHEKKKTCFFQQTSTKLKMDAGGKDQSKPPKPIPLKHLSLCHDFQLNGLHTH